MGDTVKKIFSYRMLTALFLGYASGLPYLLSSSTLQAWMTREEIDLKTIGFISIIGLPYSLKIILAPFLDRFAAPILGRRKGWMFIFQALIVACIVGVSLSHPKTNLMMTLAWAFGIAVFSAAQDIVVDAYRRELLPDEELGLGSSLYVTGYRLAMLMSGGLAFILASSIPWSEVYKWMAVAMAPMVVFTVFAPKEKPHASHPKSMMEAVVGPMKEFFHRDGAWFMLFLILFYKLGDSIAANMTIPFIIKMGYSDADIGYVAKTFGMGATIAGGLVGGMIMLKVSMKKALFGFGILQAISTLGFALLVTLPKDFFSLAGVIAFENLASGMGTAAYAAFMASLTNKKFTVTQYALLTSIMGLTTKIIPGAAGVLAEAVGWEMFFVVCTMAAIPGLLLLIPVFRFDQKHG